MNSARSSNLSAARKLESVERRDEELVPVLPNVGVGVDESGETLSGGKAAGTSGEYDTFEDSDVFVYENAASLGVPAAIREVTLFVHGWDSVEPGLLSWTFPSLRSALDAVRRMRNAIGWCVVSGSGWSDLDAARASGSVLVEQLS